MKSRTKNHLDEATIRTLVREQFGRECRVTGITELEGGMFNAIYRIKCTAFDRDIVLKVGVRPGIPLLTYERDIMPVEVEAYRLISERTTVPVPQVLAHDFSKTLIDANYFFMTALDGVPLSKASRRMSPENLAQVKVKLAEYLVQLHGITNTYFGYPTDDPTLRYATWHEAFLGMFEQLLRDARDHGIRLPFLSIERALERHGDLLDALERPCLVDFDCHEGNVFVRRSGAGYAIEGILDFERMFWGDPIADFPTAFVFCDDIREEPDFLKGFLAASGRREFARDDDRRYQLYRLYIATIMAAETFRYDRMYGTAQRIWATAQVRKCLSNLDAR
ncbi:phosphotransferase family protein [uncultured Bifidobacterium sp.]|uniref:phosphotransferase family protein n=1 Tax=uncultured Bifidobacterium sp. TaxID=165187 RepID=UPI00258AD9A5|nr:aminoglycoside phosphotransferase family protein [uncultured Bifidobacterium sp.]